MISPQIRRVLEQLARLDPDDLTAWGMVQVGTESARVILTALQDAATLQAVRALLEGDRVSVDALRALVTTSGVETIEIVAGVKA
jgi:hypothetical protein